MQPIECYMIEPTGEAQVGLTRWAYVKEKPCPLDAGGTEGSHEAEVIVREKSGWRAADDDPRYPTHCACGYEFVADDERYMGVTRLIWRRPETGEEVTLSSDDTPPGAMFWADWHHTKGSIYHEQRGGGPHLHVLTPGGTWDLDAVASNGPGWEWHGTPPKVTARPSIIVGNFHGWLTDGVLTEV